MGKKKKYMNKDEKIKHGAKIFATVFAIIVVIAIVVGVVASTVTEAKRTDLLDLTDNLLKLYKEDPWNAGNTKPDYSDKIWEYYRMIMLIDRHACYQGYEGYQFDGDVVCVDLSDLPEEDREGVKELMIDYLTLRGKKYRFNSKAELDELGLLDHNDRKRYTEGCLLSLSEPKEQPDGSLLGDVEVYYHELSFVVSNIGIFEEKIWEEHAERAFDEQIFEKISKDSFLYKNELLNGKTVDTYILTAAEKKVYCISQMEG